MKSSSKFFFLFIIFSMASLSSFAQSKSTHTEKGWPVSKGVQLYSNKSLATHKTIKFKSVGTPSYTQSKEVQKKNHRNRNEGNIPVTGTPDWAVSKQVNLINR